MRLLFIGNSFTQRNDLPGLLASLAADGPEPVAIEHERLIINGASLKRHWNAGEATQRLRDGGPWDWVVLQEQSTLPAKNASRYHENARLFVPEITAAGSRPLLYLTWARKATPETQIALNDAVLSLAREVDARVAPVGPAWSQIREEAPDLELYDNDGSHPSALGSILAAWVFHATLLGRPPAATPGGVAVDASVAALFTRATEAAVARYADG